MNVTPNPIGVFDSGYGGLSILKALRAQLPEQDFLYLGDHANAPYGARIKEDLFDLSTRNVAWLFRQNCHLVILACNTASALLRSLQRTWQQPRFPKRRVLGVVVPTIEKITGVTWDHPTPVIVDNKITVGIFATEATVKSDVYPLEIHKSAPHIDVVQQVCPSLTALIEEGSAPYDIERAVIKYVLQLMLQMNNQAPDYIILGCTHYALVEDMFRRALPEHVEIINQAECVARSLADYLKRHPEFRRNSRPAHSAFFTTGDAVAVNQKGARFLPAHEKFQSITI
jgi:glutamate racemase